MKKFNSAVDS